MKRNISFSEEHAVSELVGGLLLLLIALMVFSVIYLYVFPLPTPPPEPNVDLMGYVTDDGIAVIAHMGGEALSSYRIQLLYMNGTLISSTSYQDLDDAWGIAECIYPLTDNLLSKEDMVRVIIYSGVENGNEEAVFDGIFMGKGLPFLNMLIPSLLTNTADEDLICFNYSITPNIDAETYVYSWLVNGFPFAEIIWSFNTNDSTTVKDYSGNGFDGEVINNAAIWTPNGIVGGAYYFDGGGDRIALDLPNSSVFNEISRNDFTISIWIKSDDIDDPHKVVLETGENKENFVQIVQHGSQIHFGVYVQKTKKIESIVNTSSNLSSNVWYNIVGTWDADQDLLELFLNGKSVDNSSDDGRGVFSHDSADGELDVGGGGGYWQGYIDEFQVYPRVLSKEQIYQFYLCTKDGDSDKMIIVSEEINVGESWQCIVTPNGEEQDDEPIESNVLEIVDYPGGG